MEYLVSLSLVMYIHISLLLVYLWIFNLAHWHRLFKKSGCW